MLRCWSWAVLVGQVGAVGSRGHRSSRSPSRVVRSAYYVYAYRSTVPLCRCTVRPRNCCSAFAFSYRNSRQPCFSLLAVVVVDHHDPNSPNCGHERSTTRVCVSLSSRPPVAAAAAVVAVACCAARAPRQMTRRAPKQLFHRPPFRRRPCRPSLCQYKRPTSKQHSFIRSRVFACTTSRCISYDCYTWHSTMRFVR